MKVQINSMRHQSGAVLLIAMLMLLVMTTIGITTMKTARLEEKMAGRKNGSQLNEY